METFKLTREIKVFGLQVQDCPEGVGDAFYELVNMVDGGFNRSYYGICEVQNGSYVYRAAAEEIFDGEAIKYACEPYVIAKGEYLAVTVRDWRKKTESIKDVVHEMMQDTRVSGKEPFVVEWYKDDVEMVCMVKINA